MTPIAADSRHGIPLALAAKAQPPNFPALATSKTRKQNPHDRHPCMLPMSVRKPV
jgi:hypothetical protein